MFTRIVHSPVRSPIQVAMATDDEEAQEDELLALASICNKDVFEVCIQYNSIQYNNMWSAVAQW